MQIAMYFCIIAAIVIFFCPTLCQLDVFNSIFYFESFLEHENFTLAMLENYVEIETKRIENLQKAVIEYKNAINNGKTYGVDDPVQFYLVMKNIVQKWNLVNSTITQNTEEDVVKLISDHRQAQSIKFPMGDDLNSARVAIQRLQQVYDFKNEDIIEGKLLGNDKSKLKLDAYDCFEMGRLYYYQEDYNNTYMWMRQAVAQLDLEADNHTVEKLDVLKYLVHASFKIKQTNESDEILWEIISLVKDQESFYHHLQSYSKPAPKSNTSASENEKDYEYSYDDSMEDEFKNLCGGTNFTGEEINSTLYCFYKMDRPFLRLAPLKVEVLHYNPDVYLFRQVMSDEEIDIAIRLAKDRLGQAMVVSNGMNVKSLHRTAKNAWLLPDDHDILPLIDQRISDITNLDATYAEPLQIANYDIGGHYSFHYDALKAYDEPISEYEDALNDRIATVLFYLSTPYAGGMTGFPKANLAINATKNDAIFWYNLLKNGEADFNTLHGGCPVLSGQKWIANKWIRQNGQEFLRQCSLNEEE